MKKYLISLLMAVVLLFGCGLTAHAADEAASGTCGTSVNWSLDKAGVLTISGSGAMKDYGSYASTPWYSNRTAIKSVVIQDGITSVGSFCFAECSQLTSVSFGADVKEIHSDAFYNCKKLATVALPANLQTLGSEAFRGCVAMTSVTFGNKLTSVGMDAFRYCNGLTKVTLPDSITSMDTRVFYECMGLTEVHIPNSLTYLNDFTFSGCTALQTVTGGAKLEWVGMQCFEKCSALVNIQLSDTVTTIHSAAFSGCSKLQQFRMPANLQSIRSSAFKNCTVLNGVSFPSTLTSIGNEAFRSCSALTAVTVPDSVEELSNGVFANCTKLAVVNLPKTLTKIGDMAFFECYALQTVVIPNSVTSIGKSAFMSCTALNSIAIPNGVTELKASTFEGCGQLATIIIPNAVTAIGQEAFSECTSLFTVHFLGDAPAISSDAFTHVTANCWYSPKTEGWNDTTMVDYGGKLTWKPVISDEPFTVTRISGKGRCETAIQAADTLKSVLGVTEFDSIIIASGMNFADALAGSYLAACKSAPILLYQASAVATNQTYIKENLSSSGTVYLLGGTAAVPADVENGLKEAGINVKRLSGKTRFDTNLAILNEAGIEPGQEILVCTGYNFADSLSASAVGLPILLVNSTSNALSDAQKSFLSNLSDSPITVIGGTGAVSDSLMAELKAYGPVTRLKGSDRYATSVAIAEKYFFEPEAVLVAYGRNFPDGLSGGPLAYAMGAPLLLTQPGKESTAAAYVAEQTLAKAYVLGGTAAVSDETVTLIFGE